MSISKKQKKNKHFLSVFFWRPSFLYEKNMFLFEKNTNVFIELYH